MTAPKGNKFASGNKGGGRKSDYKKEYIEWVEKLAKLGATDVQLAEAFEVSEQTINNWKKEHEEFNLALKKGKLLADANVAESLYHRALGYSHPAVKIMTAGGAIEQVPYTEHYPPDTAAAIFWLKNRQPKKWRDKPEEGGNAAELSATLSELIEKLPG